METEKPSIWSRVQPNGGTQVPKDVRDRLHLKGGDILVWELMEDLMATVRKGTVKEVTVEWPHKTSR